MEQVAITSNVQIIDPKLLKSQLMRGLTQAEIAKLHGVNPSSVCRYIQRNIEDVDELRTWSDKVKLDDFDETVRLGQAYLRRYLAHGIINFDAIPDPQKTGFAMAANSASGTAYDKSRLERGLSTGNESVHLLFSQAQSATTEASELSRILDKLKEYQEKL